MADDPDGAGVIEPEGKLRYVSATIRRSSVGSGVGNGLEGRTQSDAIAGSKNFVEQMTSLLKGDRWVQTAVRQASVGRLAWPAITAVVSEQWGQDWETLEAGHGNGALAAALYLGRQYSDKTLRELGQLAGGNAIPGCDYGNSPVR